MLLSSMGRRLSELPEGQSTTPRNSNKHQQRTAATKRKLLKAAMKVFARDGFDASRIDDIVLDAGFTRGAFYAHFQSKEDLFFALLEEQLNAHMQNIRKALEQVPAGLERWRVMRNSYVGRAADRQWSILMLEFKLYAVRHARRRAQLAESYRRIRTKIKQELVAHLLPDPCVGCGPLNEEQVRLTLEAVLHGITLQRAYDGTNLSEDDMSTLLGKVFDMLTQEYWP